MKPTSPSPPANLRTRLFFSPLLCSARPQIEQFTIYALALSRLTSLRHYHFKCAWFDDEHYFEFYPLHVVLKKKRGGVFMR
jgi:hypothetical protein